CPCRASVSHPLRPESAWLRHGRKSSPRHRDAAPERRLHAPCRCHRRTPPSPARSEDRCDRWSVISPTRPAAGPTGAFPSEQRAEFRRRPHLFVETSSRPAENIARDDKALDLRRAVPDFRDPRFTVHLLDETALFYAPRTKYLHRLVRNASRRFAGVELRHRRFSGNLATGSELRGSMARNHPRRM